nr:DUF2987 domain-containing protein [Staphylococcus aureus]
MKITNCKIKKETIVYEVLTSGNQPFTYELPKDLSSHNARVNVNIKMYINDCIRMYKIVC